MTMETTVDASSGATAASSSFYAAMRILPRAQREAMFQIYTFCRHVDDIADSGSPRPERLAALQQWRDDIDALYQGHAPERLRDYSASVSAFGARIFSPSSTAWKWMCSQISARQTRPRSTCIAIGSRAQLAGSRSECLDCLNRTASCSGIISVVRCS
jgi:hypothetical protein